MGTYAGPAVVRIPARVTVSSGAGTVHAHTLVAHTVAAEHGWAAPEVCVGAHLRAGAGARGLDLGTHERAAAAPIGARLNSASAHVLALGEAAGRQVGFARSRLGPVVVVRRAAAATLARGRIPLLDAVIGEIAELTGRAGAVGSAQGSWAALGLCSGDGDQRERRQPAHLRCTWLAGVARWSAAKRRWRTHALPRPLVPGYVLSVSSCSQH